MKKYSVLLLLPAITLLQFCSNSKKAAAPPAVAVKKITFDDNVKPLVNQHCSPCHTNPRSHFNEFADASAHAGEIIARISLNPGDKGFMPMKHDKLADSAIAVFVKWKADGLLEKAQ